MTINQLIYMLQKVENKNATVLVKDTCELDGSPHFYHAEVIRPPDEFEKPYVASTLKDHHPFVDYLVLL